MEQDYGPVWYTVRDFINRKMNYNKNATKENIKTMVKTEYFFKKMFNTLQVINEDDLKIRLIDPLTREEFILSYLPESKTILLKSLNEQDASKEMVWKARKQVYVSNLNDEVIVTTVSPLTIKDIVTSIYDKKIFKDLFLSSAPFPSTFYEIINSEEWKDILEPEKSVTSYIRGDTNGEPKCQRISFTTKNQEQDVETIRVYKVEHTLKNHQRYCDKLLKEEAIKLI